MALVRYRICRQPVAALISSFLYISVAQVSAHEPFLDLAANEDGSLTIEVGFSDGTQPTGTEVLLKEASTGRVLERYSVPESGIVTTRVPSLPYRVTFEGGPGHVLNRDGPMAIAAAIVRSDEPSSLPGSDRGVSRFWFVAALLAGFGTLTFALGYWAGWRRVTA